MERREIGRRIGGRRLLNLGEIQAERLEATEIRDGEGLKRSAPTNDCDAGEGVRVERRGLVGD
jgi:hypothetical protein